MAIFKQNNPHTRVIFLRMLSFLKPFIGEIALSITLGVAAIASLIGLFGTSAYLIARAAMMPSIATLQIAIVGVRFFGISRSVFRYLERLASHSVSLGLISQLRVWFYQELEPLAPARLLQFRSGDLLSRTMEEIETLESFYTRLIAPVFIGVMVTAGVGLWTGIYSPLLAWLLVSGLLITGIGIPTLIYYLSRKPSRNLLEKSGEMSALLVDFIQGMRDLIANGSADWFIRKIHLTGEIYNDAQKRISVINGISNGLTTFFQNLTLWTILVAAIPLVGNGTFDGIMLSVMAMVTIASCEATQPLPSAALVLEKQIRAAGRLFAIVDTKPEVIDMQKSKTPIFDTGLVIEDLSFRYGNDFPYALLDISLKLDPGQWIAIVGPNGAGKTTLLNLLLRFWDYHKGSIKLGGVELRKYKTEDVRAILGVISQSSYLFSTSLRKNMLLSYPEANEDKMFNALNLAGLSEWVEQSPQGLDTWVGEHGEKMSGGERQRLAIARAILKDSPILLLDEPTAHLDPSTERNIINTIFNISQNRSLLWVTHRISRLEKMDEIIVMNQGRIIERGKHLELMQRQGVYARMWEIQNINII